MKKHDAISPYLNTNSSYFTTQ